jgi:hypothetical protein
LGSFLKIAQAAYNLGYLFPLMLKKHWLGYILGDFFPISSAHLAYHGAVNSEVIGNINFNYLHKFDEQGNTLNFLQKIPFLGTNILLGVEISNLGTNLLKFMTKLGFGLLTYAIVI